MIRYEWRTQLDVDDAAHLRDLLVRAAAYDAEPEYNGIDPDEVERDMAADAGVRHLVIWLDPGQSTLDGKDEPERVAGIIRFVPSGGGWADATIVIDPELRSIGIVTLLLEREGADAASAGGWLGSGFAGIRSWARGNHPASGRIGDRNLLPRTERVWKLVRPSAEGAEGDADRVVDLTAADAGELTGFSREFGASDHHLVAVRDGSTAVGVVELDLTPVYVDEFGRCATVVAIETATDLDDEQRRAVLPDLLRGAGARAAAAGLDGLIAYAPSTDDALVAAARRTGFQHDRTDVLYEIR